MTIVTNFIDKMKQRAEKSLLAQQASVELFPLMTMSRDTGKSPLPNFSLFNKMKNFLTSTDYTVEVVKGLRLSEETKYSDSFRLKK